MEAYKLFLLFTILLIILSIFIIINKFVGNRILKALKDKFPNINYTLYLIISWIMTGYIWIAYFTQNKIKISASELLMTVGLLWVLILSIMFLLKIIVLIVDKIIKKSKYKDNKYLNFISRIYSKGLLQLIIASIIIVYGGYNSTNIHVSTYDLTIDKKADVDKLDIVFLADTHGMIGSTKKGKGLSDIVNSLNADVVLLGGDLIDELSQNITISSIISEFKNIKSKNGVFGILGNHDYTANTNIDKFFKDSNITLLKDDFIELYGVYIVGSNYIKHSSYDYINSINLDINKPIIYLNHVPKRRGEEFNNCIDLQLSGHTHKGQVFPGSIITNLLFSNDHGYIKIDNTHFITTSGFGVWGPKVRIGSKSEIIKITVRFTNK